MENISGCRKAIEEGRCAGDCCGLVPLTEEILEKHKDKIQVPIIQKIPHPQGIVSITSDLKCIFLNRVTKLCMIYEDRPDVCRMYGISNHPALACPYVKPNGNPRSEAQRKHFQRIINHHVDKTFKLK